MGPPIYPSQKGQLFLKVASPSLTVINYQKNTYVKKYKYKNYIGKFQINVGRKYKITVG